MVNCKQSVVHTLHTYIHPYIVNIHVINEIEDHVNGMVFGSDGWKLTDKFYVWTAFPYTIAPHVLSIILQTHIHTYTAITTVSNRRWWWKRTHDDDDDDSCDIWVCLKRRFLLCFAAHCIWTMFMNYFLNGAIVVVLVWYIYLFDFLCTLLTKTKSKGQHQK